jgi:hypothetical protein
VISRDRNPVGQRRPGTMVRCALVLLRSGEGPRARLSGIIIAAGHRSGAPGGATLHRGTDRILIFRVVNSS